MGFVPPVGNLAVIAVTNPPDDRSPMARAFAWSSWVTAISLEMVVPGMIGFWVDLQLGTVMLFLVLGVILGMSVGVFQLVRLTTPRNADSEKDESANDVER